MNSTGDSITAQERLGQFDGPFTPAEFRERIRAIVGIEPRVDDNETGEGDE